MEWNAPVRANLCSAGEEDPSTLGSLIFDTPSSHLLASREGRLWDIDNETHLDGAALSLRGRLAIISRMRAAALWFAAPASAPTSAGFKFPTTASLVG